VLVTNNSWLHYAKVLSQLDSSAMRENEIFSIC
jgi:hypothetical protein